ncbi:histidine phosphatase family protein [Streptomyces vilmorinianum]|uniref:histidine phosphatase family protein n=1 Tax=Streptomyces vilmorinianum TaxID=3051092 RepID=UPI0020C7F506|nr:histidine phosphatase family protein [Streptomyces vilmorinianum]
MNAALREARFDDDGPVEAVEAAPWLGGSGVRVHSSPSGRCRATAEALGLAAVPLDALAGCAMGRWRGRRLDELAAQEGASVAAWLSDPEAVPHGGESLRALRERVGVWLDGLTPGRIVAVVEPDVLRAAVVHALGAGDQTFWRLDVRPLASVALSGRSGRWNVRLGEPLTPPTGASDGA